jgi:hypothetical protein
MSGSINVFKIRLIQHLILLIPLAVINCILVFGCYFLLEISLNSDAFIITICIFFVIDALPTLIAHFQYWMKNKGNEVIIDTQEKLIDFKSKKGEISYSFDQIKSVHYYCSYAFGSGWHSFGQYRYYKIIFEDGNQIFITCLMVNSIEKVIPMLLRINEEKHLKVVAFL